MKQPHISNSTAPSLLSIDQSTAIKGLYILLIVIGHNYFFTVATIQAQFMTYLYTFHIAGFFILSVMYGGKKISLQNIGNNIARLLWPDWLLTTIFYVGYNVLWNGNAFSLKVFIDLLIWPDSVSLSKYCGFQVLWFLPAMFSLLLIRDIWFASPKLLKIIIYAASFLVVYLRHGNAYGLTTVYLPLDCVPFEFLRGLYFMFFGITTRFILERIYNRRILFIFGTTISILLTFIYFSNAVNDNYLVNFNLISPIFPISFFIIVWSIKDYISKKSIFMAFGRNSLIVYLIHPFVGFVLIILIHGYWNMGMAQQALISIITLIIIPALSLLFAKLIKKTGPLYQFIFPRYFPKIAK